MVDRSYYPEPLVDGKAVLEGDEARHLIRVRRVGLGEPVELFDGRGTAYRAEVSVIGRDRVELTVSEMLAPKKMSSRRLTLASAVPKGERFDWLVEKATELGVDRLIPIVTERSVVDPRAAKLDRLRRVIVEACKQSRRDRLMDLDAPQPWTSLVGSFDGHLKVLAHPGGLPVADLGGNRAEPVILAIGPEGGFSDLEVDRAVGVGWQALDLGSTTLRVETAGLAGCSTLMAMSQATERGQR